MVYITPKRRKKEKLLDNCNTTDFCPICFATGYEIKRTVQFIKYECEKCKHKWDVNPFYEEKIKKTSGIVIRDKSDKKVEHKENVVQNLVVNKDINQIKQIIEEAIDEKKLVQFDYTKQDQKENRLVQPYRLELRKNELSLFCYDLDNDGIRLFKLANIENITIKDPKDGN